jgi:hypothetical protein
VRLKRARDFHVDERFYVAAKNVGASASRP